MGANLELPAALYELLHPESAAVSELLAAGIDIQRVLALYPSSTSDYAGNLPAVLSDAIVRTLFEARTEFNEVSANLYGELLEVEEGLVGERWATAFDRFMDSGLAIGLEAQLNGVWLEVGHESSERRREINEMLENLYDLCWLLATWPTLTMLAATSENHSSINMYRSALADTVRSTHELAAIMTGGWT